jgi:hypothetical protein
MEPIFFVIGIFIGIWGTCCCSILHELYINEKRNHEEYSLVEI